MWVVVLVSCYFVSFFIQTGVFRSDLPEKFRLVPSALQALIDNVDRDLTFAIEVESGVQRDTVSNYDEVGAKKT